MVRKSGLRCSLFLSFSTYCSPIVMSDSPPDPFADALSSLDLTSANETSKKEIILISSDGVKFHEDFNFLGAHSSVFSALDALPTNDDACCELVGSAEQLRLVLGVLHGPNTELNGVMSECSSHSRISTTVPF